MNDRENPRPTSVEEYESRRLSKLWSRGQSDGWDLNPGAVQVPLPAGPYHLNRDRVKKGERCVVTSILRRD
jgi:hypothetical protein